MLTQGLVGGRAISRRRQWVGARTRRDLPIDLERLEDRPLMSTLVWLNESHPDASDTDSFNQYFGPNAPLARTIVHQAMSDWEQVIADFNYTNPGKPGYATNANTFGFNLAAHNIGQGVLGYDDPLRTIVDKSYNDAIGLQPGVHQGHVIEQIGKPFVADITIDDDGGGHGWYFDPHPADSVEFAQYLNPFAASGNLGGREDFYSAVSRQIGEAVGLSLGGVPTTFDFGAADRGPDPVRVGGTQYQLYAATYFDRYNTYIYGLYKTHYASAIFTQRDNSGLYDGPRTAEFEPTDQVIANDLMSVDQPVNTRFLISDIDVGLLASGYSTPGMSLNYPTDLGKNFLTPFDPSAHSLTIRADPRVTNNTIVLTTSGTNLNVTLNDVRTAYPLSSLSSITIDAGPGSDAVTLPGDLITLAVTVNGGGKTNLTIAASPSNVSYVISAGRVTLADPAQATSGAHSAQARAPRYVVNYAGLSRLTVNGGSSDRASVVSTPAATSVTLFNVGTVTVGSLGSLGAIAGPLAITGSGLGMTALTIDDSTDPVVRSNVHVSEQTVIGLAPAAIGYTGASLRSLTILGGPALNRYVFDTTPQNARGDLSVTLTTGPLDDFVRVDRTASGLIVDGGAGTNDLEVTPSAIFGQLLFQSTGGTYDLLAYDLADTQTRAVTLGTFQVPPRAGSAVAAKARLLGTIDGFSPGEIVYDPASLRAFTIYSGQAGPGVVYPFGNTFTINDTFTPARPGAATRIILGAADTVLVAATHGPLNVVGKEGGATFQVKLSTRTRQLDAIRGLVTVSDTGVDVFDQNAAANESVIVGTNALYVNGMLRVSTSGVAHIRFQGSGRGNAYYVQGTPGAELILNGGTGSDYFQVSGSAYSLDGLTTVGILGGGGNDSLLIADFTTPARQTYDINSGTVLGSPLTSVVRTGGVTVNASGVPDVTFYGGIPGDTIRVNGYNPGTALSIIGSSGDDTIAVKGVPPGAAIYVDGGGGTNTLDDSGYTPAAAIPAPTGLVAFFKGEGDATDALGLHGGSAIGAVTSGPGEVGQAFRFDGKSSGVMVPDFPALDSANVTVEAWVKSSSVTAYSYILSKGAQGTTAASYALYTGAGSGLTFYIFDGTRFTLSPDAGKAIWDGNWHHVAGTYDGSRVRLFVDGKEVGSGSPSTLQIQYNLPNSKDLFLGTYHGPTPNSFNGAIDELSVYNRALSGSEIQGIFAAGSAGKTVGSSTPPTTSPQPVSLFKGEGNANDALGQNNGQVVGGVSFAPGQVGQAFQFNGIDSYVDIPDSPSLTPTAGVTLDVWIRPDTLSFPQFGAGRFIIGKAHGYALLLLSGSGYVQFFLPGTDNVLHSNTAVPLNAWTRLTSTYDVASEQWRLYINGVLDVQGHLPFTGPLSLGSPNSVQIGANATLSFGVQSQFIGRVDEAAIYDRALTPTEVSALVNGGSNSAPPSTRGVVVDLPLGKATGLGRGLTRIQNVIGTAFDDILVGNTGGTLSGGPGRDLVIAGPLAATIDGGPGDDILIGGTTTSDLDLSALDAILADWSDTQSDYTTRVARLRAGRLASGQVTSNGRKNSLQGGDGLNLYFASLSDVASAKNGETVFRP